jgi:hypothetical protein
MALTFNKKTKSFTESDQFLSEKFRDAGFGALDRKELRLHPLEAAYIANTGKSRLASPMKASKDFKFSLAIYTLIRGAGRLALPTKGGKYLRAYAPGIGRTENRPSVLVCLLPGRLPPLKSLQEEVRTAHLERLDLVVACGTADEPKFYKISAFNF